MGKHQQDETTHRIRTKTDIWRDITHLSDRDAAACIYKDKVDLLVDLSGHTAWNRLGVFALRPAPVQLTYLGYPNTTGLSTIDYRIVDAITDPQESIPSGTTEQLIRLPHTFMTYLPPPVPVHPNEPPSVHNGYITFGSFNALPKINPAVIETWCSLLETTGNSRLLLKNYSFIDKSVRDNVLDTFVQHKINPDRIELLPPCQSTVAHLELYNRIDIALDTFPYNGTTTTCEALWMGVPVIILQGSSHAGRVGLSILHGIGLEEFAASGMQDYIMIASELANNMQRIKTLRRTLRNRLSDSMLGRHAEFTSNLETVYRTVWQEYTTAGADTSGRNRGQTT
jgi:predicted O-linked N-acetylglucosamine transferase (SPINDLY family)